MAGQAEGTFKLTDWDESPYQELDGKTKLTRARMTFRLSGDLAGDLISDSLMYYREDGTAEFTGLQRFSGEIAGRSGSCVMLAGGAYRDGEARSSWQVIEGSGTGGLAGLTGSGASVAPGGPDGSYSLGYELG
jgi:hypothetical protein